MTDLKPGPELDRLVAEKVMGWETIDDTLPDCVQYRPSSGRISRFVPTNDDFMCFAEEDDDFAPSRCQPHADEVWDKMVKGRKFCAVRYEMPDKGSYVVFTKTGYVKTHTPYSKFNHSACLVICLAALKAVEREENA